MLADIKNGQKTGYFLDQKENRFAIRKYQGFFFSDGYVAAFINSFGVKKFYKNFANGFFAHINAERKTLYCKITFLRTTEDISEKAT